MASRVAIEPSDKVILDEFEGKIEPVRRPLGYHFAELLVACVMVILPLIYVALIVLAGWVVYMHAIHNIWILAEGRGRGRFMAFVIYLAPIVAGAILVAFMFKPLFSRPKREERDWSLNPEEEPLLFAFVNELCEVVRAPKPGRIDVDTNVNASASFRRGMFSMLGSDLVLTIGLPLVAGLSLRQFAGVLAHEFGHFSQGAGMRLTYIIRTISHWFARVVYERDAWDEWLEQTAGSIDLRVGWVLHLARFFVWLTRKILWVLMMIGQIVSGHMLRQMEFDADRHEARLAGSDVFESTMRGITRLGYAQQAAMSDLGEFYGEGRLSDDFADLVVMRSNRFEPDQLALINDEIVSTKTGWLDTHPADVERIANAHREEAAGVFRMEVPAEVLFQDFASTSREYTTRFYQEVFGEAFSPDKMFSNEELFAWQDKVDEAHRAMRSVFLGEFPLFKQLDLPRFDASTVEIEKATKGIKVARHKMLELFEDYRQHKTAHEKALEHWVNIDQGRCLWEAGIEFADDDFFKPLNGEEKIAKAEKENQVALAEAANCMQPYEKELVKRIAVCLGLAQAGRVPLDEDTRELVGQVDQLRDTLKRIDAEMHFANAVRLTTIRIDSIFKLIASNEDNEALVAAAHANVGKALSANRAAFEAFDKIEFPFDHAQRGTSIARYCVDDVNEEHPGAVHAAGEALHVQIPRLRARIFGVFGQITEAVEEALGFEPLPQPATDDD